MSVGTIDRWHRDNGWRGIGYHLVVHLDGSVSEGRPFSQVGAHVAGRNANTLGFVYVGGVDAQMNPKDTRTEAQKRTMRRLTQEAIDQFDLLRVSGHHDYAAKACPCFPARQEYQGLIDGSLQPIEFEPLPETARGRGTVTASALHVRGVPATTARSLGTIPRGTLLEIYGTQGDWANIRTPYGVRGWVHRNHVATEQDDGDEEAEDITGVDEISDILADLEHITARLRVIIKEKA